MTRVIAVTGATGFVGRVVVAQLLAAGHSVKALVRDIAQAQLPISVACVEGDLKNTSALQTLTHNADAVVHIAGAIAGVTRGDFFDVNVDGTVALAKAAKTQGVKRFVHVSSMAAREPDLNFYAESKAEAEQFLTTFDNAMLVVVLRPAAIYGPGDKATLPLLNALMSRIALIPGTPDAQFGMVHVEDVARAVVEAVMSSVTGMFEIDDGSGGYGWRDLIAVTQRHFGVPRRVVYLPKVLAMTLGLAGDIAAKWNRRPAMINTGQMKQIYHLDWRVKGAAWPLKNAVGLTDGLPQTIQAYQASGLLPRLDVKDRSAPQHETLE
jgi:nucleoside-diphosphate-sugar epimerase